MESSKLADRLRGIVAPKSGHVSVSGHAENPSHRRSIGAGAENARPRATADTGPQNLERLLGGEWRDLGGSRSFVVERVLDANTACGNIEVGDLARCHERAAAQAPMLSAGAPARAPFLFFDLETTGLSGGAGTYAFLVGCGSFADDGGFVTKQFLLTSFSDERAMLVAVAAELSHAGALVSFNGKSFDAPLLETRYQYHRLAWAGGRLPHIDVLHPSRRFWRDGPDLMGFTATSSCSLAALELQVLGARRSGDVAGFEIPVRYFQFVRSGDARPIAAVLEHNRLDLLSLAGLSARLLHLLDGGPAEAKDAREAFALGRTYARAGMASRAIDAYQMAITMRSARSIRLEILRSLAQTYRRSRRFDEAAGCWRQVLEVPGCPAPSAREATEALAIHHEHRARDLAAAKTFALKSLDEQARPAWNDAVRHRLARIERKMTVEGEMGSLPL
jgi:uncharacterized protein YprB with RNaseH-like and TPR domain